MKLKYYLRGIGIGIMMATVILMIAFAVHKEQPLSDDEIRARAKELGMVMAEDISNSDKLSDNKADHETDGSTDVTSDASENMTDGEVKGKQPENTKETSEKTKDDTQTADASEKSDKNVSDQAEKSDKTDKSDKSEKEQSNQEEPQTEVIEQVEITIVGGEYSDAVCKKLKKAGVIDDVDAFNKYLSKKGYDNLIQPGTYVVPLGADYATVAKLITDKKNRKEG